MTDPLPASAPGSPRADLGMRVTLELISTAARESMEIEIVPDQFADIRLGFLGIGTPLARAIVGHKAGDQVTSLVDDSETICIIRVVPSQNPPPQAIADRRTQTIRSAIDQSDHTNAVIFASSFSGKWGDYDPGSIAEAPNSPDSDLP